MRILGITLDRSLSFRTHVQETKLSCESRLNLLRSLSGKHLHSNRLVRQRVANAIVYSKLIYGIELTSAAPESIVNQLAPIYNRALRITSGLLPSTPADTACAEAGLLPFRFLWDLTLCRRSVLHMEKTASNYQDPLIHLASARCIEVTGKPLPKVAKRHWNGSAPWGLNRVRVDRTIQASFKAGHKSTEVKHTVREWISTTHAHRTIRYTDGSKTTNGVGFGLTDCTTDSDQKYRLPSVCSVFSAEAAAIYTAVTTEAQRPLLIVTDSASVINALLSARSTHPWIQAIQTYVPADTIFAWVPGHSGVVGNERADKLADEGRTSSFLTKKVPAQDIKPWLANSFRAAWERHWASQDTPLHRLKGHTLTWTDVVHHRDQQILSRLRTGHTRLSHNFSGNFRHIICPVCSIRNTAEHVICNCPQYEDHRTKHGIDSSVRNALANCPRAEKSLLSFLRTTKLYWEI